MHSHPAEIITKPRLKIGAFGFIDWVTSTSGSIDTLLQVSGDLEHLIGFPFGLNSFLFLLRLRKFSAYHGDIDN
jgi:hypothetical protein